MNLALSNQTKDVYGTRPYGGRKGKHKESEWESSPVCSFLCSHVGVFRYCRISSSSSGAEPTLHLTPDAGPSSRA